MVMAGAPGLHSFGDNAESFGDEGGGSGIVNEIGDVFTIQIPSLMFALQYANFDQETALVVESAIYLCDEHLHASCNKAQHDEIVGALGEGDYQKVELALPAYGRAALGRIASSLATGQRADWILQMWSKRLRSTQHTAVQVADDRPGPGGPATQLGAMGMPPGATPGGAAPEFLDEAGPPGRARR